MIDEYFEWLFKIVTNDKSRRYRELCEFLFSKDFYYTNEYDANRVGDGLNLRERFIDEHRMSIMDMQALRGFKCSVLEMMIGLVLRCDETIMRDASHGDRTSLWFYKMICSLHLDMMDDEHFDEDYCNVAIERMLNRQYLSNGDGGLFTVRKQNVDMRKEEYWYQAMIFFNEYLSYD
ncbi:hypothetical protein LI033_00775 [bacterium TM223]|uniref:hypothetical protein n=2 Tax=Faecalibacillus intestinalis TaxID=1982626 RepID=UPI00210D4DC4|nr:hypothetical protein [Faecalibacillus intestinalis]MCB7553058.1 hypothetical protein [bacterium TM223]MCQ4766043.1 hypothetical protein [Faecalibacillus intestinalis]